MPLSIDLLVLRLTSHARLAPSNFVEEWSKVFY